MDLLDSDQQLVDALPPKIREHIDGFCLEFVMQTAIAWNLRNEPLPQNYMPESVDVYVGGQESSCLFVYEGQLKHLSKEFFGDRVKETLVVAINDEPRFVQLHGEVIADSLGGCLLPEIMLSPEVQLTYLAKLAAS